MAARSALAMGDDGLPQRYQSGDFLPVAMGGTGDTGTAWTSGSVTASAASGTIGSNTATFRFRTLGKTVFYALVVNVSAAGSGANAVVVPLPVAATGAGGTQVMSGRENALNGKVLQGYIPAGASNLYIQYYDATYPGASGAQLLICGHYESA